MTKVIIVPRITSKEEKWHKRQGYRAGHIKGDKAEIKAVGKHQFDKLNKAIQKLPKGHWAATHTEHGNVHISQEFLALVPPKERKMAKRELRIHEVEEHKALVERRKR